MFLNDLSIGYSIEIHGLDLDYLSRRWDPKKVPRCVPRTVKRAATLSPSAINSSSVGSAKSTVKAATARFTPRAVQLG
jgi:hypothetical protein